MVYRDSGPSSLRHGPSEGSMGTGWGSASGQDRGGGLPRRRGELGEQGSQPAEKSRVNRQGQRAGTGGLHRLQIA